MKWLYKYRLSIAITTLLLILGINAAFLRHTPTTQASAPINNPTTLARPKVATPPFDPDRLINEINGYREYSGIAGMQRDFVLDRAAQLHAEDMKKRHYYSHTSPDGVTAYERINNAIGYPVYGGENQDNVCTNVSASDEFVRFTESLEHNANLLDPKINVVGIGYAPSDSGKCNGYLVTDFAQL